MSIEIERTTQPNHRARTYIGGVRKWPIISKLGTPSPEIITHPPIPMKAVMFMVNNAAEYHRGNNPPDQSSDQSSNQRPFPFITRTHGRFRLRALRQSPSICSAYVLRHFARRTANSTSRVQSSGISHPCSARAPMGTSEWAVKPGIVLISRKPHARTGSSFD